MNICIRKLTSSDVNQINTIDKKSGFLVLDWIDVDDDEPNEHVWGAFFGLELIGYCTLGYADDCGSSIANYPGWNNDCLILSNVFVLTEYRKLGFASKMIKHALKNCEINTQNLIFLTLLTDRLERFYSKLGFARIADGYSMVKVQDNN